MDAIRKLIANENLDVYLAATQINASNVRELKVHEAKKLIRIFEEEGYYDAVEVLKTVLSILPYCFVYLTLLLR